MDVKVKGKLGKQLCYKVLGRGRSLRFDYTFLVMSLQTGYYVQDVKWQAGREYTPADAVAQVLRNVALADLRVLSRNIADWFSSL